MEGAAIAQAAQALGLPFLIIRAMSDNANHEASISFDEFIIEAGRRLPKFYWPFKCYGLSGNLTVYLAYDKI